MLQDAVITLQLLPYSITIGFDDTSQLESLKSSVEFLSGIIESKIKELTETDK